MVLSKAASDLPPPAPTTAMTSSPTITGEAEKPYSGSFPPRSSQEVATPDRLPAVASSRKSVFPCPQDIDSAGIDIRRGPRPVAIVAVLVEIAEAGLPDGLAVGHIEADGEFADR